MAVKSDIILLEENRDQARSMALALEVQIDLTQGKVLSLIRPDQEKERVAREQMLIGLKKEKAGHDMMVEHFDTMIAEERKHEHVRGSDK